ncbi:MAG: anti-sigma factor [Granulosicoccus sp.]
MSAEENSWDLQAAEYVLGTLSEDERKVFDALYRVDSDWQRRVHQWQERLNPLHESTTPVDPPEHVLAQVLAQIHDEPSSDVNPTQATTTIPGRPVANSSSIADSSAQLHESESLSPIAGGRAIEQKVGEALVSMATLNQWKERARYWQLTTLVAVLSLVGLIVLGPSYLATRSSVKSIGSTVAVLQGENLQPLWAVSYAPENNGASDVSATGTVSITVVGQPQLSAEQSHQLWMVLPEGAGVQSVGLVPNNPGETITVALPIGLNDAAEFAVSLEPLGGVPGPEHGPVVARTFIVEPADQTSL